MNLVGDGQIYCFKKKKKLFPKGASGGGASFGQGQPCLAAPQPNPHGRLRLGCRWPGPLAAGGPDHPRTRSGWSQSSLTRGKGSGEGGDGGDKGEDDVRWVEGSHCRLV